MPAITTLEELTALYGSPVEAAIVKEVDRITPHYRAYIDAAPFAAAHGWSGRNRHCGERSAQQ